MPNYKYLDRQRFSKYDLKPVFWGKQVVLAKAMTDRGKDNRQIEERRSATLPGTLLC